MPRNKALNIWLLKAGEPLPLQEKEALLRMGLLAEELVGRGHHVTWWTSAWDHRHKKWLSGSDETLQLGGLRLILLRGLGYHRNISLRRLMDHRLIAQKFKAMSAQEPRPDVIVASLPPYDSAFEAVQFGRRNGVPVIVDLRDEWPDLFLDKIPNPFKSLGRLLLSREFALMKRAVSGATALTSMMEGMLKWGLERAGRQRAPGDQVYYLGAPKAAPVLEISSDLGDLKKRVEGKIVVTYVGTFGLYADPRYLLSAARQLPGVAFVFAGEGPLLSEMKKAASELKNVFFPGWLSSKKIGQLLSFSDYGICPNTTYREALPNKAISFFGSGLPVLCFLQGDIKTIIESERLGYCFDPADVDSLVSILKNLRRGDEAYLQMKRRVDLAFAEKFDGKMIYKRFADHIEQVARPIGREKVVESEVSL